MDIRLEKRISPRRNTLIHAEVMYGGGLRAPCIIRNVSDTGAKLEIKSVGRIPDGFELLVPGHRPQPCLVVWRSLREMGIRFLS